MREWMLVMGCWEECPLMLVLNRMEQDGIHGVKFR